jgi:uncharacterized protein
VGVTFKRSRYAVASPRFEEPDSDSPRRVIHSLITDQSIALDASAWEAFERGDPSALDEAQRAALVAGGILVDADFDERAALFRDDERAVAESDRLYLVVQPTAACQLGCGYCGQEHTNHTLSSEDQDRTVERAARKLATGRYRLFEVGWFGAEPLLGMDVIRALTPRFQRLAAEHGVTYSARIVTNGVALRGRIADELGRQHGVDLIEVTLDGTAASHDARRGRKQGGGSFERILANLREVAALGKRSYLLSIRCNVDSDNCTEVLPLIRLLQAEGAVPDRFYVAPIHAWGNDADRTALSLEEYGRLEIAVILELLQHGIPIQKLPKRRRITCMVREPGAELVDPFGELFNCSETSLVPSYQQPTPRRSLPVLSSSPPAGNNRFRIGDLANGTSEATPPFVGFFGAVERGEYPCYDCHLLPVCGGSCPKMWEEGKPPCPPVKVNIETRVMLQYLAGRYRLSRSEPAAD